MAENYYFTKLCWVCLAEESNMHSLIDKNIKIHVDNRQDSVSLYDLLSYVVSAEVLYVDGPYLICNNCKLQACAAYKFKKRCEVSAKIFKKCGLISCEGDLHDASVKNICDKLMQESPVDPEESKYSKTLTSHLPNNILLNSENEVVKEEVQDTISEDDVLSHNQCSTFENDAVFEIIHVDSVTDADKDAKCTKDSTVKEVLVSKSGCQKFLCTVCGIERSRSSIRQHMLRHSNIKEHTCPFCQKKFSDKGNLKVHIRIHTGVHPYACDICSKTFIQSTGLKIHKRVHDDVKPYKCHLCSYCTRTSSHLLLHVRRHEGVKNYHCDDCDYSACSKAELKYHLAKHSNDKNHICGTCGKGFARYKGLKIHEKSHTGEKPHMCELCGRGFTQGHSLRSHLRNIHKLSNLISNNDN